MSTLGNRINCLSPFAISSQLFALTLPWLCIFTSLLTCSCHGDAVKCPVCSKESVPTFGSLRNSPRSWKKYLIPTSQFSYCKSRELNEIISFPVLICLGFNCSPVSALSLWCLSEMVGGFLSTQSWWEAAERWHLHLCSSQPIHPLTLPPVQGLPPPRAPPFAGPWYTNCLSMRFGTHLIS